MNLRLFLAIEIPEQLKHEIFEKFSKKISSNNAKIVPQKNIHFTLKFLGHLPEEKVQELVESLKEIEKFHEFKVKLEGIGSFGKNVLWIEGKDKKESGKIVEKINQLLSLEQEKAFSLHATIARMKKNGRKEIMELLQKFGKTKLNEKFLVEEIDLMKSDLSKEKPEYAKIYSFKLSSSDTFSSNDSGSK